MPRLAPLRRGRDQAALNHRRDVRHRVPHVHADARHLAHRVQRRDGLLRDVQAGHVEGLEHHLRQSLAVRLGGEHGLGYQARALVALYPRALAVEHVGEESLELVPVLDAAIADWSRGFPAGARSRGSHQRRLKHPGLALGDGVARADKIIVVIDDHGVVTDRRRHGRLPAAQTDP